MADTFTDEERSKIMWQVKSGGNKSTELKLINLFKGYRIKGWRRNYKIYGKPDFVFPKKKVAIFVDGCFWHGHNCRNTSPEDNKEYWLKKINKNVLRDKEVSDRLTTLGWKVLRIWECELKKPQILDDKIFNCV